MIYKIEQGRGRTAIEPPTLMILKRNTSLTYQKGQSILRYAILRLQNKGKTLLQNQKYKFYKLSPSSIPD